MTIEEPPLLLDGARVLRYAHLEGAARREGRESVVVDGVPMDAATVSRLVIAENLVEDGVFLLHCNDDWSTVMAAHYADAPAAVAAAGASYAVAPPVWIDFRELTPIEAREVETTRAFLRELAAEDPARWEAS